MPDGHSIYSYLPKFRLLTLYQAHDLLVREAAKHDHTADKGGGKGLTREVALTTQTSDPWITTEPKGLGALWAKAQVGQKISKAHSARS